MLLQTSSKARMIHTAYVCFLVMHTKHIYILDAVRSSRILIGKQKLGRTFNSDKLGGIAFTKISKLTMCSAYEEAQAIVPASTG